MAQVPTSGSDGHAAFEYTPLNPSQRLFAIPSGSSFAYSSHLPATGIMLQVAWPLLAMADDVVVALERSSVLFPQAIDANAGTASAKEQSADR